MLADRYRSAVPLVLVAALAGCSGGGLGDVLGGVLTGGGGGGSGTLTVEVQEVRTQSQEIYVRTEDGQQGAVLFDSQTQVVYNNESYPVTALEYGDIVDMRVQEIQQGLYTDLIQVRTPVQERQGAGGGDPDAYQMEGTIGTINLSQDSFTLNMTQGGTVSVFLPSNASRAMRDRLRDYRSGDYVRVTIRPVSQERAELVRWGWN